MDPMLSIYDYNLAYNYNLWCSKLELHGWTDNATASWHLDDVYSIASVFLPGS